MAAKAPVRRCGGNGGLLRLAGATAAAQVAADDDFLLCSLVRGALRVRHTQSPHSHCKPAGLARLAPDRARGMY